MPNPNPFISEDDPAQPASVAYRSVHKQPTSLAWCSVHNVTVAQEKHLVKSASECYLSTYLCIYYYYYYFFRYLKWMLGGKIGLVARCEYDAVMTTANSPSFVNIKALNEWDSKVWG